ncbi:hypothetical protein BJX64DRAFT_28440 [Aspergillus heterothallicus]
MSSLFLHSLSVVSPLSFLRSSSFCLIWLASGPWSFFFVFLFIIFDYISQYYIHPGPYCPSHLFFFRSLAVRLSGLTVSAFQHSAFSIHHQHCCQAPPVLSLIVSRGHLRHCLRLGLWLCGSWVPFHSLASPLLPITANSASLGGAPACLLFDLWNPALTYKHTYYFPRSAPPTTIYLLPTTLFRSLRIDPSFAFLQLITTSRVHVEP